MATITSNSSGNWATGSTWVGGSVPAADDLVVIAHGHKVTLNTNIQSTRTGDVTINGNLHFDTGGKMHLHGRMTVYSVHNSTGAGDFVDGDSTTGSLLSMVNGTEIKISGSDADQHGILIATRRWCGVDIQGGEPTLYTSLNGAHPVNSSYLSVTSASNFASGDLISLYEREVDYRVSVDECLYVHYADTVSNILYIRQFVGPESTVVSASGTSMEVTDARVFRIGQKIVFGTGANINVKEILNIQKNIITFSTSISGSFSGGEKVYLGSTEKYHPSGRIVRRLSTTVTTAITSTGTTNQVTIGNASDLSAGDEILLEANTDDGTYNYLSGGESNVWRHNLLYTISSINGNTLTLNRNIDYKSDVGCKVAKITRDIVIKACASNGDEVSDGDQNTARVFFSVQYWTSTTWYDAPTRRIKLKYIRFKNLGYNTYDSTNFRAGLTIAGYNGVYRTDLTYPTTSGGVSQTGENYIDGCTVTAYSLCSNTVTDGDSYPSLCIRHPYGMVSRNCITLGTGYGFWRWSSGYFTKDSGHICMVSNSYNTYIEAMYAEYCSAEYFTCRMSEDGGFRLNNIRETSIHTVRHIDVQVQQTYGFRLGYLHLSNGKFDRWYANKYRYTYIESENWNFQLYNSQLMPNLWDGSNAYYNNGESGVIYSNYIVQDGSGYYDGWRNPGGYGKVKIYEHGFKSDEHVELSHRVAKVKKDGNQYWDVLVSNSNRKSMFERVYVPANVTVKIKSQIKTNTTTYTGENGSVNTDGYPYLIAKPANGIDIWKNGRSADNMYDSSKGNSWDNSYFDSGTYFLNSTNGDLASGFIEHAQHTSASFGAWESKEITVQPQKDGYFLTYGLWWDNNSMREEGMQMMDFEIIYDKPSVQYSEPAGPNSSRKSVRTSFDASKKRISSRI